MRVLFLDDNPERHRAFRALAIGHVVDHAWTAKEAIEKLARERYDLVSLDHDLNGRHMVPSGPGTGYEVAAAIAEMPRELAPREVWIHSFNHVGAQNMLYRLAGAGISASRLFVGDEAMRGRLAA